MVFGGVHLGDELHPRTVGDKPDDVPGGQVAPGPGGPLGDVQPGATFSTAMTIVPRPPTSAAT